MRVCITSCAVQQSISAQKSTRSASKAMLTSTQNEVDNVSKRSSVTWYRCRSVLLFRCEQFCGTPPDNAHPKNMVPGMFVTTFVPMHCRAMSRR